MRKIFTLISIALLACMMSQSCQKLDVETPFAKSAVMEENVSFYLDNDIIIFNAGEGAQTVRLYGATGNLGCNISGAFNCFVSAYPKKVGGDGEYEVTINVTSNAGDEREHVLYFTDGKGMASLLIRQKSAN